MNETGAQNRASVLTPPGRGAVAIVAATGPAAITAIDANFRAASGRRFVELAVDRIAFGHWESDSRREEVIVLRGLANSAEIHCHGGAAAAERITAALAEAGCEIVSSRESLDLSVDGLLAAEADEALSQATTRRAAAILLDQRKGALLREIEAIHHALAADDADTAKGLLRALLGRAAMGLHLTKPWHVAIGGKPNVGKSSLINVLAGYQRAIVFDEPGTTRDVLAVETAIDGWPVRLTDAAGLRDSDDPLEAEGVNRARGQLLTADLVLWVIDGSALRTTHEAREIADREFAEAIGLAAAKGSPRALMVANKRDLLTEPFAIDEDETDVIWISALTGAGIDRLLAAIAARLAPMPPTAGECVPFNSRQVELLQAAAGHLERGEIAAAIHALRALEGRGAFR